MNDDRNSSDHEEIVRLEQRRVDELQSEAPLGEPIRVDPGGFHRGVRERDGENGDHTNGDDVSDVDVDHLRLNPNVARKRRFGRRVPRHAPIRFIAVTCVVFLIKRDRTH